MSTPRFSLQLLGSVAFFALAACFFPVASHAATIACTASSGCGPKDTCYFPGTSASYCALTNHTATCAYGCCAVSDCGTGQSCFNQGTPFSYCAVPVSTTPNPPAGGSSSTTPVSPTQPVSPGNPGQTVTPPIPTGPSSSSPVVPPSGGATTLPPNWSSITGPLPVSVPGSVQTGWGSITGPYPSAGAPGTETSNNQSQGGSEVSIEPPSVVGASSVSIAGVQGYDPSSGAYTTNTAVPGSYLVLYGNFAPTGNIILIDGTSVSASYQSATQINVSLSGIALGTHIVSVATPSAGTTAPVEFTVQAANTSTAPLGAGATNAATVLVPYFWGGSVSGYSGSSIMSEGLQLAKNLGAKAIRIAMSASSDIDYKISSSCIPNFTLTNLAKRSDFNAILSDPQFATVIITAYDGASFGDCNTKSYFDPAFFTPANTQKVESEYTDFANYLKQFDKTFIIANWEGDNDAYCGAAFTAEQDAAVNCPGAADRLAALGKWFAARHAGIVASGASNVFDDIEFDSVDGLKNAGLPSVLYNVVPSADADYYSYSSYESINVSAQQFSQDIDTVQSMIPANKFFIGEMGFAVGAFGDASTTAARLQQMIGVAQQKNIPYAVLWNLLDYPSGFGLYDGSGNITTVGKFAESAIGKPVISPSTNVSSGASQNPAGSSNTVVTTNTGAYPLSDFPMSVTVTVASLNVRSAPNTAAPLAGSETLSSGDTFTAINEVVGQSVSGNDLWWISSQGNYVWSGGTETSSSGVAANPKISTPSGNVSGTNPSISDASYDGTGGELYIDGTFDASGNTVLVNGAQISNDDNGNQNSAITIAVTPDVNGSVLSAVQNPPYTITVKDSQGTATFTVTSATTLVLNSVQGYNPTTNVYEKTNNVLNPGDTYLILYGSFPASGNAVIVSWTTSGGGFAGGTVAYQDASQINFSLTNPIPAGVSSLQVHVYNTSKGYGQGGYLPSNTIGVTAMQQAFQSFLPKLSDAELQSEIENVDFSDAVTIATNAGYLVYVDAEASSSETAIIEDPSTGAEVAAITEQDN